MPGQRQRRQRRGIGAKPEPCAVAKADEAGIAGKDVHARGGDGEDDDLGCRGGGLAHRREQERQHDQRKGGEEKRMNAHVAAYSKRRMRSPIRPRGRSRRTTNISR